LLAGLGMPRRGRPALVALGLLAPVLLLPPWLTLRLDGLGVGSEAVSLPTLLRRELLGHAGTTNGGQFLPRWVEGTPEMVPRPLPGEALLPSAARELALPRGEAFAAGPSGVCVGVR